MNWIPRWLATSYAKLFARFAEEPFDFATAVRTLECDQVLGRTILSRLRRAWLLSLFSRMGRARLYRLLDPETWIMVNAFDARNLDRVKQGAYFNLLCKAYRSIAERHAERLVALVLYGSVARGSARPTSDLDLLVVADSFSGTVGSRIDGLLDLEEPRVKPELAWLNKRGIDADISYLPLTLVEAASPRLLYLDLVYDAIILHDRHGFFRGVLNSLRTKLDHLQARRVALGKEDWYWILKPQAEPGDVVEL